MLWHLGNTTIRTPYRLRDALIALQASSLNGNLIGKEKESELTVLLHEAGVAEVARITKEDEGDEPVDYSDFGRKWRSALTKLGFITQKFGRNIQPGQIDPVLAPVITQIPELSGKPYEITPSGHRLIKSEVFAGQQECFLRSLLAIRLPSVIEDRFECNPFSPLKYIIDILFELKNRGEEVYLSFEEIALFVITSSPDEGLGNIIDTILSFRQRRAAAVGSVRAFDREEYSEAVLKNDPGLDAARIKMKSQTLDDYADCTLRYLKATGLFRSRGRGISLNPIKEELAQLIHDEQLTAFSDTEYLIRFYSGAQLPTDNPDSARQVVTDLTRRIEAKGVTVEPLLADEDVDNKRFVLEQQLTQIEEEEYYRKQPEELEDILAWMNALLNKPAVLSNGEKPIIPRAEGPAYFEWAIWRAFLAINSLVNKPWEARRFQIDQDFLPVGTAPGNGPDMVFEFADAILVVEVTLTSSSRQEAAEGEPVRRHVAKYAEQQGPQGKAVYGLFIAINIDSNTAHTFRTGDWYLKDDSKINLHIVPLKLEDFFKLLQFGNGKLPQMPEAIQSMLLKCRAQANQDAPTWKRSITTIIDQIVTNKNV